MQISCVKPITNTCIVNSIGHNGNGPDNLDIYLSKKLKRNGIEQKTKQMQSCVLILFYLLPALNPDL